MSTSTSLTVTGLILLACFTWMDVCLYYEIQSMAEQDVTTALTSVNASSPPGFSPTASSKPKFVDKFSFAFQGMSVKLMMTDSVDNYLLAPLSDALVELANFKEHFWFITPNLVSYAGVLSALVAAKLVSHDSSTLHKLSFFMFQLRTWLDDLDGALARSRMGIVKHMSLTSTPGYVIDGICDAIGFVAYILGCYVFLRNKIKRNRNSRAVNRYNLQSITEVKSSSPPNSTYVPLNQHQDCALYCEETNRPLNSSDVEVNSMDDEDDEEEVTHFNAMDNLDYYQHSSSSKSSLLHSDKKPSFHAFNKEEFRRSKVYLKRKIENGKQSSIIFYRYIKEKIRHNLNNQKLALVIACFLLQIAMCATFWNRYILVYHDLLETTSETVQQAQLKSKILKSNITYVIIWFWRWTNGHSWMQMLIASVFFGKMWQFLDFIKYIGFVEIIILATVTELHVADVRRMLT